jgi:hypothetical protein
MGQYRLESTRLLHSSSASRFLRFGFAILLVAGAACSSKPGAECVAAGGQCGIGPGIFCPNNGPQQCGDPNVTDPAGHYCCLPCPKGTKPSDASIPATCVDAAAD